MLNDFSYVQFQQKSYLVHRELGSILLLNDSAAMLYELLIAGLHQNDIAKLVSEQFAVPHSQVVIDIDNLKTRLQTSVTLGDESDDLPSPTLFYNPSDKIEKQGNNVFYFSCCELQFELTYPNTYSAQYLLEMLKTLEVEPSDAVDHKLVIYESDQGYELHLNGEFDQGVVEPEWLVSLVIASVSRCVCNTCSSWMSLHASGVAITPNSAVVFAGQAGSGKTAIATWLSTKGYRYLGDDVLLFDLDKQRIHPFPMAPKIKQPAWPLFQDDFAQFDQLATFESRQRILRFAPLNSRHIVNSGSFDVTHLVFPTYNPTTNGLKSLSADEGLQRLGESNFSVEQNHIAHFANKLIPWMHRVSLWQLDYSSFDAMFRMLIEEDILLSSIVSSDL